MNLSILNCICLSIVFGSLIKKMNTLFKHYLNKNRVAYKSLAYIFSDEHCIGIKITFKNLFRLSINSSSTRFTSFISLNSTRLI